MDLKELQNRLEVLTSEITKENFTLYYDKFTVVILDYKESRGLEKPLDEILWVLARKNEEDDYKDEVLMEVMNRLKGYCSPHLRITFSDLEKN